MLQLIQIYFNLKVFNKIILQSKLFVMILFLRLLTNFTKVKHDFYQKHTSATFLNNITNYSL